MTDSTSVNNKCKSCLPSNQDKIPKIQYSSYLKNKYFKDLDLEKYLVNTINETTNDNVAQCNDMVNESRNEDLSDMSSLYDRIHSVLNKYQTKDKNTLEKNMETPDRRDESYDKRYNRIKTNVNNDDELMIKLKESIYTNFNELITNNNERDDDNNIHSAEVLPAAIESNREIHFKCPKYTKLMEKCCLENLKNKENLKKESIELEKALIENTFFLLDKTLDNELKKGNTENHATTNSQERDLNLRKIHSTSTSKTDVNAMNNLNRSQSVDRHDLMIPPEERIYPPKSIEATFVENKGIQIDEDAELKPKCSQCIKRRICNKLCKKRICCKLCEKRKCCQKYFNTKSHTTIVHESDKNKAESDTGIIQSSHLSTKEIKNKVEAHEPNMNKGKDSLEHHHTQYSNVSKSVEVSKTIPHELLSIESTRTATYPSTISSGEPELIETSKEHSKRCRESIDIIKRDINKIIAKYQVHAYKKDMINVPKSNKTKPKKNTTNGNTRSKQKIIGKNKNTKKSFRDYSCRLCSKRLKRTNIVKRNSNNSVNCSFNVNLQNPNARRVQKRRFESVDTNIRNHHCEIIKRACSNSFGRGDKRLTELYNSKRNPSSTIKLICDSKCQLLKTNIAKIHNGLEKFEPYYNSCGRYVHRKLNHPLLDRKPKTTFTLASLLSALNNVRDTKVIINTNQVTIQCHDMKGTLQHNMRMENKD